MKNDFCDFIISLTRLVGNYVLIFAMEIENNTWRRYEKISKYTKDMEN